jgi:hypothetical protein
VRFGDLTLEALARSLYGAEGAGVLDLDELSVLLRGFGTSAPAAVIEVVFWRCGRVLRGPSPAWVAATSATR